MKIQSASIDVPGGCPNRCKFCVSELTAAQATGMLRNVLTERNGQQRVERQYLERLQFLRDNGVNTAILTGTASEPLANMQFLKWFAEMNRQMSSPFKLIEIQTSGVMLNQENLLELDNIGVKTISLSLSSLDSATNSKINGTPEKLSFEIPKVCKMIKDNDFNLRLSLNINRAGFPEFEQFQFNGSAENMFKRFLHLGADQVTFRKLYTDGSNAEQARWIESNKVEENSWLRLKEYIMANGRALQILPFGATKYSIHGLSTVIDTDCMAKDGHGETLKYVILRRNCKLYSDWSDPASLIF